MRPSDIMANDTRSNHRLLLRVVGPILVLVALYVAWRNRPFSAEAGNSAATLCRVEYSRAYTADDSARVDRLVPAWLAHPPWRRVPSCGDLRAARRA